MLFKASFADMSCSTQTLCFTAGQIWDMPVTFTDNTGYPIDLTGATVAFMAKASLDDDDDEALVDVSQTNHINAIRGETTLPIDLSSLAESYFVSGGTLKASLWVEDADSNQIPYGLFNLDIQASAKYKP
jgi:hypothetical protein